MQCIRSHCTNHSKGKTNETESSKYTNTHTLSHHARHYSHTHTHKRILRTLQIGHSQQQQQITVRSVDTKRKEKKKKQQQLHSVKEKRRHRHLAAFCCRFFFSLWTFERHTQFSLSLVLSIVTLARLNHNTHNFESPLQRTFFFIKFSVCSRHDFVSLNIRIETTTQKGCVLLSKYFCFAFFYRLSLCKLLTILCRHNRTFMSIVKLF